NSDDILLRRSSLRQGDGTSGLTARCALALQHSLLAGSAHVHALHIACASFNLLLYKSARKSQPLCARCLRPVERPSALHACLQPLRHHRAESLLALASFHFERDVQTNVEALAACANSCV